MGHHRPNEVILSDIADRIGTFYQTSQTEYGHFIRHRGPKVVILSKHREPKVVILSDIAAYFLGHVSFSRQANAVPMSERCQFHGSGYSLAVFGGKNEVVKFH